MLKKIIALVGFLSVALISAKEPKIVGLMQVRNEAGIVEQTLRCLRPYVDALVVLDDASDDETPQILERLANELSIEKIILETTSGWQVRTEIENRQKLLDTGRAIGGTHFIELDADEIFTATCMKDNWLRKRILALEKGQILHLPIINLWKSFDAYRAKWGEFPDIVYCSAIFCDDGVSTLVDNKKVSHSGFIHFGRFPVNRVKTKPDVYSKDLNYAILHLPFVNWDNTYIKRDWIMCLERIRLEEKLSVKFPRRTVKDINEFYNTFHDYGEKNMLLKQTPPEWLAYDNFDKSCYITRAVSWKERQLSEWFKKYGRNFFRGLDLWKADWSS